MQKNPQGVTYEWDPRRPLACVAANGASRSRRSLGRGVGDEVAGSGAAALEGVVEPDPVPYFVG
jgi:hypothetical protein